MGGKDLIWVCWQEPASDCGKTSQIPYSWVTEVIIGDGRAPGSVIKCRWTKTKKIYTAKVIAKPSTPTPQNYVPELSAHAGDDSFPSIADILAMSVRPKVHRNGGDDEESSPSVRNTSRKRPGSKTSSDRTASQSPAAHSTDNYDPESDGNEREPPFLMPERNSINHGHFPNTASIASAGSSNSPAPQQTPLFPKDLQRWFMEQFNYLKTEMINNFDHVNRRMSAMDASIMNVRDRVSRLDSKIDMALLNMPPNGNHGIESTMNQDDRPPPLKRQRGIEMNRNSSFGDDDAIQMTKLQLTSSATSSTKTHQWNTTPVSSTLTAINVTPAAKRNARKSIVHRAAPISPPPFLLKEAIANSSVDRKRQSLTNPVLPKLTPIPSSTASKPHSAYAKWGQKKRRAATSAMVVEYKPDSNNQIIFLGGDPEFEISRQLYAETLENIYDESPIYLVLSLLRRLLCDQDVAKLWFKADQPPHPNTYVLSPAFAAALKRQGTMQYPHKPLTERDYSMKLSQATYDAKHRVKHGKGSTSRPESYFSLEKIAILASPALNNGSSSGSNNDAASFLNGEKEEEKDEFDNLEPVLLLGDADSNVDETETRDTEELEEDDNYFRVLSRVKDEESGEQSSNADDNQVHEDEGASSNVTNAIAMLADMATDND